MSKKMFAIAGNWNFIPGPKGISVFEYESKNGTLQIIDTVFVDIAAGQQIFDRERGILYVTDECDSLNGKIGGGGYVVAFRLDSKTGKLTLINKKESLSSWPCYICMDKTRHYALVAHHGGSSYVSKINRGENGGYYSSVVFEDTALVSFRINMDGSIGEVCDAAIIPGEGVPGPHAFSHLHSVVPDPSGKLFVVCDKGMDKIYSYGMDQENGSLFLLSEITEEINSAPRYGVFHPVLPVFYANFEKKAVLKAFNYNSEKGTLNQINAIQLLTGDEEKSGHRIEASDILIHPSGKNLYAAIRGVNRIVILDIDKSGSLAVKESIDCGGKHPRGFCISPDGRFLFCANMESGIITSFSIKDNGCLEKAGETEAPCPANMSIIAAER